MARWSVSCAGESETPSTWGSVVKSMIVGVNAVAQNVFAAGDLGRRHRCVRTRTHVDQVVVHAFDEEVEEPFADLP
jgi:hypothetical protein